MRLKRLLPIAIGGGIGGPVVIFIIIMAVYPNLIVRGIIMGQLEKEFGGRATAEEVSFSWKRGVVISNLLIQDEDGQRTILTVDSIHLKFKILALFRGRVNIERFDVNRPEMLIYRSPLGPSGPLGGVGILTMIAGGRESEFPEIKQARISDGTFVFTDLSTDESTKVEDLNLRLSGIEPGGTAQINGECDIVGGGGSDHAVISGALAGYGLRSIEALQGNIDFKSGLADAQVLVDMSGLSKPGTEIIKMSAKVNFDAVLARLGGILTLPEDVRISGNLASKTSVITRAGGSLLLKGTASATDLYLQADRLFDKPIEATEAVTSYEIEIDPAERLARIEEFVLETDGIDLDLSGEAYADGTFNAKIHLSAPLGGLVAKLGTKYRPSAGALIAGELISDTEVQGTLGGKITLRGKTRVTNLDVMFESFEYSDPEVTLEYDLDYDQANGVLNVRTFEGGDGILAIELEECVLQPTENGHYQGELYLLVNMEKVGSLFKVPEFLRLIGTGKVYLNFEGKIITPIQKGLRVSGTLGVDTAVYEAYKLSNISVDEFKFDDNHLNVALSMRVNDAAAGAVLDLDLIKRIANVKRLFLNTDKVNLDLSGVVYGDGRVEADVHVTAPLDEIGNTLAQRYPHFGELNATGSTNSDIEIKGTVGDVFTLNGSTRIERLTLEYKSYKYSDPAVTLQYGLDYNNWAETVHITRGEIVADLLSSRLKDMSITLGDGGHYQGNITLDCNMEKFHDLYGLPPLLTLKGVGEVGLDFHGSLASPFYESFNADGYMAMEEAAYKNQNITVHASDIATERLSVVNSHVITNVNMLINGAPADGFFDVDLALDEDGGPYIGAELHMTRVPVTYTLEGGDLSGLVTLDVDEAWAEGGEWDETFRKTLTAKGNVKIEEGVVSATEILSTVFMGLAKPGVPARITLIKSDFDIRDEKIYTVGFHMNGAPFNLDLSGWIGFDKEVDYDAVILFSGRNYAGIQKVFRKVLKDSPIPLKITGRLPEVKVKFTGGAGLKGILVTEKVIQGPEAIVKGALKTPKRAVGAPKAIVHGIGKILGGGKKATEEKKATEGPEIGLKELEDIPGEDGNVPKSTE